MNLINYSLLFLILFTSCSTIKNVQKRHAQNRIDRILKKNPTLLESDTIYSIRIDTIQLVTKVYEHDTIINQSDTMIIETERFKTVIIKQPYETIKYKVNTLIKSDTVQLERIDSIPIIKKKIVTKTEYVKVTPKWIWWFVVLIVIIFGIMLKKLFKNEK